MDDHFTTRPTWARSLVVGDIPDHMVRQRLAAALMPYRDFAEVREQLEELGPRPNTFRHESPRNKRR